MVNTRILEQRLGWRATDDSGETLPPSRPIAHAPLLQGRVDTGARPPRHHRRAEVEDIWSALPVVLDDVGKLAARGTAPSIARGAPAALAMDQLRTQLLRVLTERGWRRIGVTSPARGAGRSFVAAGLAASIARLETLRVLLIDADLAEPGLQTLLGVAAPGPLEAVLSGSAAPATALVRVGSTLALALNSAPLARAAERMMAPDSILGLRAMVESVAPDVVIHDLPPLLGDPVAPTLLSQLDAVILVADGTRTTARDILECERILEGQVPLLGVVLNKSEDRSPRSRR